MLVKANAKELRKALAEIEAAEKNGFEYCEAVFNGKSFDMAFVNIEYSDLIERAHPSDSRLNWGRRQGVTKQHKFIDGELIRIEP